MGQTSRPRPCQQPRRPAATAKLRLVRESPRKAWFLALIVTTCLVLVIVFNIHSDAWSPAISQGDPHHHIALHLEFTGKVNGVMTRGNYVAGQISQDPAETGNFAPLTACSVLDLKQEGENEGWVGLVDIEGDVRGKAYSISIESDFQRVPSRGIPRNTYDITTYPPQYPSAAAALYSKNGTFALSFATPRVNVHSWTDWPERYDGHCIHWCPSTGRRDSGSYHSTRLLVLRVTESDNTGQVRDRIRKGSLPHLAV
jgi:hypothetical protein